MTITQEQLQARLTPTPYQFQTAGQGLFKSVSGDPTIYKRTGNAITTFNPITLLTEQQKKEAGNYGEQSRLAISLLKDQYGIDINSLSSINPGDFGAMGIQKVSQNAEGSVQWTTSSNNLSGFLGVDASKLGIGTANTQTNQLAQGTPTAPTSLDTSLKPQTTQEKYILEHYGQTVYDQTFPTTPTATNPQKEIQQINTSANEQQQEDLNTINDYGPTAETDLSKFYSSVLSLLSEGEAPEPPSALETFNQQRADLGVDTFEGELSGIDAEIAKLDADWESTDVEEGNRLVSMGSIKRRRSALGEEYTKQKGELNVKRTRIVTQLNNKYSVLNTMITLTGQDYENAQQAYQSKISNAINLTNLIQGISQNQKNDQERAKDNARANLDVMYDTIKSGNLDYNSLPETTKLEIKNMELQAGLPVGWVSFVQVESAGKNISFHRATPDGTGEIIYYDDGSSKVITFSGVEPKETESTKILANFRKSLVDFPNQKDEYGKVITREQFIRMLQAQYPEIEGSDIEAMVYQTYPDNWQNK